MDIQGHMRCLDFLITIMRISCIAWISHAFVGGLAGGNVRNAGRGSVSASQGALRFADGQGGRGAATLTAGMQHRLAELRNLYKGVFGAATGAGIIIGTYFAFYSTTKNALRRHTSLHEGGLHPSLRMQFGGHQDMLCQH